MSLNGVHKFMEQSINDVNGNSSPVASEGSITQPGLPVAPVVTTSQPTPVPGSQTPSENLLAALKEERVKRKELEDKLQTFNTTTPSEEVYSDEGKVLLDRIAALEARDKAREEQLELERIYSQFPLLREKANEFKEYRETEHPRAKIESVAKLYLNEQGLLDNPRKGLEKPTGGPRTPMTSEPTVEEVKALRENNPAKYRDMLKKGLIKL